MVQLDSGMQVRWMVISWQVAGTVKIRLFWYARYTSYATNYFSHERVRITRTTQKKEHVVNRKPFAKPTIPTMTTMSSPTHSLHAIQVYWLDKSQGGALAVFHQQQWRTQKTAAAAARAVACSKLMQKTKCPQAP